MQLDQLVQDKKMRVVVDKTYEFSLPEVKEAFKYLMAGHASGKVVITIRK